VIDRIRTLLGPPADEDSWGYDPAFARAVQPALDALYDRWWRVTVTGTEHVPAIGHALIAANHAGVVPWDGAMIVTAVRRHGGREVPCAVVGTGAVPAPTRWRIEFSAPVDVRAYGPDAASDRRLVLELSDAIREQIQATVYENLIKR